MDNCYKLKYDRSSTSYSEFLDPCYLSGINQRYLIKDYHSKSNYKLCLKDCFPTNS